MPQIRLHYEVTRLDSPEDFLRAVMRKHGLRSFEQVAAYLNISSESVRRYRRGDNAFSDEVAGRIAHALSDDDKSRFREIYALLLVKMAMWRTPQDSEGRTAWGVASAALTKAMKEWAKHGFRALAFCALGMGVMTATPPAQAAPGASTQASPPVVYYVKY